MKKLILSLSLLVVVLLGTSCTKNEVKGNNTFEGTLIDHVIDAATGDTVGAYSDYCRIDFSLAEPKANLVLAVSLDDPNSKQTIYINGINYQVKNNVTGYTFSASSVVPVDKNGISLTGYSIKNLQGQIYYQDSRFMTYSYTITTPSGKTYTVKAHTNTMYYINTETTFTNDSIDSIYVASRVQYTINIDPAKHKAWLQIDNLTYNSKMVSPQYSTRYEGLDYKLTADGYVLTADSIKQSFGPSKPENYILRNATVTLNLQDKSIDADFMMGSSHIVATGTMVDTSLDKEK